MWSDLILDPSSKVKQGQSNLKVLITCLLFDPRGLQCEIMGRESSDVGTIDLGTLPQGQTMAKLKSAYN